MKTYIHFNFQKLNYSFNRYTYTIPFKLTTLSCFVLIFNANQSFVYLDFFNGSIDLQQLTSDISCSVTLREDIDYYNHTVCSSLNLFSQKINSKRRKNDLPDYLQIRSMVEWQSQLKVPSRCDKNPLSVIFQ